MTRMETPHAVGSIPVVEPSELSLDAQLFMLRYKYPELFRERRWWKSRSAVFVAGVAIGILFMVLAR